MPDQVDTVLLDRMLKKPIAESVKLELIRQWWAAGGLGTLRREKAAAEAQVATMRARAQEAEEAAEGFQRAWLEADRKALYESNRHAGLCGEMNTMELAISQQQRRIDWLEHALAASPAAPQADAGRAVAEAERAILDAVAACYDGSIDEQHPLPAHVERLVAALFEAEHDATLPAATDARGSLGPQAEGSRLAQLSREIGDINAEHEKRVAPLRQEMDRITDAVRGDGNGN